MSFNAGSIDAKLTLDRSSWTKELKKTIAEADKLDGKTITIGIDADSDNFFEHYEAVDHWADQLDGRKVSLDFSAEIAEFSAELEVIEERLDRIDGRHVVVRIDTDIDDAALGEVAADIEAWERSTDFDIDVNITPDSYADIAEFMAMVEAMDDFGSIDIDVDVDGTAEVLAELELLEAKANDLDHKHIDLSVDQLSGLFEDDGGGGRLGLLRVLMYALIALSPLVAVAIGAATAAVVGFIGAMVAAAGPLLILVGGLALLIKKYQDAVKAGDEMVGPMADFADSLQIFKDALNQVTDAIGEAGFALLAQGLELAAKVLPYLVPLFNATADAVSDLIDDIDGFVDSPGMAAMIDFFMDFGIDMLVSFIKILGNLAAFFGYLFAAMEPFIRKMMGGLEDLTGSWADWASDLENNKAFQHWLDNAAEFGPKVLDMLGSLLDALIAIGHALEPFAGPMLTILTNFFDFIANMDTSTLTILIGALVSLWAGMTIVLPVITSIVSAVSGLIAVFTFLISPIGLIILAIVGLIAMFVYLYKTNEDFRNSVNSTWASIKETVLPIIKDIVAYIQENWPAIKKTALEVFNQVKAIVIDVMGLVEAHIKNTLRIVKFVWDNFGQDIMKYTKVAFQLIIAQIRGALQIIGGVIKVFKGLFTGDWREMFEGVKEIIRGAKTLIVGLFNGIKDGVLGVVGQIATGIVNGFRGAINTVIDLWNGLSFGIPAFDPPGPGKFPGVKISTPDLQHVAKGGLAYNPVAAIVGDNPGPEPEVIQPLSDLKALLADQQPAMDYERLAAAVAVALAQVLGERGGATGGGVSPEDLERLIQAASVNVQINASDSGRSVMELVSSLMFEFQRMGYKGGLVPTGGY